MLAIKCLTYRLVSNIPLPLHAQLPSSTIRGAFGYALAEIIDSRSGLPNDHSKMEIFKTIFKPENTVSAHTRGIAPPRPYVFRGFFDDASKKSFKCEILLFGRTIMLENLIDKTMNVMARRRFYRSREKDFVICNCEKLSSRDIFPEPVTLKKSIIIDFQTPASIKYEGKVYNDSIPFPALISRISDRLDELIAHYTDTNTLDNDNAATAKRLKLLSRDVFSTVIYGGKVLSSRISSRSDDEIFMNGFLGRMQYDGNLEPFSTHISYLPWLNVGKNCALGCGWCIVHVL